MSLSVQSRWLGALAALFVSTSSQASEIYEKRGSWQETMIAARERISASALVESDRAQAAERAWFRLKNDFPVQWDWALQDGGEEFWRWLTSKKDGVLEREMIPKAIAELGDDGKPFLERAQVLRQSKTPGSDRRWLELYSSACERRREQRLHTVLAQTPRIVFIKHHTLRPSFFAYTEGQSDAQNERHFAPGSELCLLEFDGVQGKTRTLLADPKGAIRDPAVSWDGGRLVFAWKKSLDEDDYHLYEFEVASNRVRQITSGLGFTDYEPAFLPDGSLIFASTRCVQTVDCWWTEVSNLYTCDLEGKGLRRIGFDQVHAIYPQVLDDGRVVYTRWDYNDRGQIFPQPLFQMCADGTSQTEFYGNNSWFPTTIAHARGIPGTEKVMAILCGHHSSQAGKLAVIDPARGRQENSGVQLVAPVRPTPPERIDSYGQEGTLWQYPFPLNDRECLVACAPLGWDRPDHRRGDADFGVYWTDLDGRRELLAWDEKLPCTQPVPLAARPIPPPRVARVDYRQDRGTFYVRDIYDGNGLSGVPRGTVKKLRVVSLGFRAAGIGHNGSAGPGGGALVSTPVSVGNGSWDVKTVLGEATVHEDGSALFTVPARTPVYFQALDGRGFAVQTMRSWSTLQPGEFFGCAGCHESKNTAPSTKGYSVSLATKAGPEHLGSNSGPGFSFPKQIQPILDRHCIRCHRNRNPIESVVKGADEPAIGVNPAPNLAGDGARDELAFSLLSTDNLDEVAKRRWSDAYLVLTRAQRDGDEENKGSFKGDYAGRVVNWIGSQSVPEPLPPWFAGAARSELMTLLGSGHKGVKLSPKELELVACWIDLLVPYCGDYFEANAWTESERDKYEHFAAKRLRMEEMERDNIRAIVEAAAPQTMPKP